MERATVDLVWIPLGAGQRVVKVCGKVFEAVMAWLGHRRRCDLYHSALIVTDGDERVVIEMTPTADGEGAARGVVARGPVGIRWLERFRVFRYEIRRWRGGVIPDLQYASDVVATTTDRQCARRLLDLVPNTPTPVWGRDELSAGEMWNSNSVTAWLLARSGVDVSRLSPPENGRAPGWGAGIVVARRDQRVNGDV